VNTPRTGLFFKSIATLSAAVLFFIFLQPGSAEELKPKKRVVIFFDHYVGEQELKLDSATYTNTLGQSYTISKLKYYISNIAMITKSGKTIHFPGSYLVNEEEPLSRQIVLNGVKSEEYASLTFLIGVDSLHNCSGAQSGDLDPAKGMFWTWNTGYVFFKLEGHSPVSNSPGHILEYHVGGYKKPTNCIRSITIDLSDSRDLADPLMSNIIRLNVDVAQLLKDPVTIDFSKLSSVTDAVNAVMLADNYTDMFSLRKP
jgi:hypothetical protein